MSPVLTLNSPLDSALSEGAGSVSPIPGTVAINGRQYQVDLEFQPWKRQAFRTTSIDQNRTQADTSSEPGESTMNPEALWRRSQDNLTHGAGQTFLDRKESDISMFRSSKGINPWSLYQVTLLPDSQQSYTTTNQNIYLAAAGAYLYLSDGTALYSTQDITVASPTWTATTGTPGTAISSLATDGDNVYIAVGADGLYWANSGGAASQLVTDALDAAAVVGYANGRLFVGNLNVLYNVTSVTASALPTPLMTHRLTSFRWVGFAEGNGFAYAAGYAGSRSYIYAITITADASALSAPVVAGQLPIGEQVTAIYGYLGFVVIGTSLGFRVATASSTGALTIGPLIPIGATAGAAPVYCFDGQDRFVWFGWTSFDRSSTGLGRMDLTQYPVIAQAPAYASDLMTPYSFFAGNDLLVSPTVISVAYFGGLHVFGVAGVVELPHLPGATNAGGVYAQHPENYVPSGWFRSGNITYDLADDKLPMFVDVTTVPLPTGSSVAVSMALDGGPFSSLGTQAVAGSTFTEFLCPQTLANWVEVQTTLNAPSTPTDTPTLSRVTTRSIIAAVTGSNIFVPIKLAERVTIGGVEVPTTPSQEWAILEGLRLTHQVVTYQEGRKSLSVYVADMDWIPEQVGIDGKEYNGVLVLTLKQPV